MKYVRKTLRFILEISIAPILSLIVMLFIDYVFNWHFYVMAIFGVVTLTIVNRFVIKGKLFKKYLP
jgi:hypothetical protein